LGQKWCQFIFPTADKNELTPFFLFAGFTAASAVKFGSTAASSYTAWKMVSVHFLLASGRGRHNLGPCPDSRD
jgi:hypothetical protein